MTDYYLFGWEREEKYNVDENFHRNFCTIHTDETSYNLISRKTFNVFCARLLLLFVVVALFSLAFIANSSFGLSTEALKAH